MMNEKESAKEHKDSYAEQLSPTIMFPEAREEFSFMDKKSMTMMVKTIRSKEVIFKYDHFLRSYRDLLWYLFTTLAFGLAAKILLSIFFMISYFDDLKSFHFFFLCLAILSFVELVINFQSLITKYRYSIVYKDYLIINIIYKLGYAVLYLAIFCYAMQIAPTNLLVSLIIPHLLNSLFIWIKYTGKGTVPWFWFPRLILLEAVQNLSIALTMTYSWIADWTFGLLYYYIIAIGWYLFSILLTLYLFLKVFYMFFDRVKGFSRASSSFAGSFLFYFLWQGPVYYYIFCSLNDILKVRFGFYSYVFNNSKLHKIGCLVFALAMATLVWLAVSYKRYKQWLNEKQISDSDMTSTIKLFKMIDIELDLISKCYLKRKKRGKNVNKKKMKDSEKAPLLEIKEDVCMLCFKRESNVFVTPCGHKCFCKNCIFAQLRQEKRCLSCNAKIEKAYFVVYDRGLDQYIGRYIYVFSSQASKDL